MRTALRAHVRTRTAGRYIDTDLVQRKAEAQGFEVFGRGGQSLGEHWAAGPRTLNSMVRIRVF